MTDTELRITDEIQSIAEFQQWLDTRCGPLHERHAARLQCRRGCRDCCVDDLTVFEVEAREIQRRAAQLLDQDRPHPPGACAFLGPSGECRIYETRPYVCRTQGLPLRWLAENEQEEIVEERDICPLNVLNDPPLRTLPAEDCWSIGPAETVLQRLQAQRPDPDLRIPLRSLFRRTASDDDVE